MTEEYWKKYKKEYDNNLFNRNVLWSDIQKNMKAKQSRKHPLELYNICKSDNPYIKQIRNSPNIDVDTVVELICRSEACDLQYCLSMKEVQNKNKRKKTVVNDCFNEKSTFNHCLYKEKNRLLSKENELKNLVFSQSNNDSEIKSKIKELIKN